MNRPATVVLAIMGAAATMSAAAEQALTAVQIIDRYVAACGGAEAWKKINTMAWTGHIETGPSGMTKAPFVMMFRRPDATHFEILTEGKRSMRVYDGKQGWKQRLTASGMPETREYSPDELSFARDASGLDGPLVDYKAKGVGVVLGGEDVVEGHPAYRLEVTLPSGRRRTDWIDAKSFLEVRYDREVHNNRGETGTVAVYYRDYRTVEGLTMPFLIETGNPAAGDSDKMIIEKIALNSPLQDSLFAKPAAPAGRHNGVTVDTTAAR